MKSLPSLGVIDMDCELVDADVLIHQLKKLDSAGADGVKVHCWWGIVEAQNPLEYNWNGYKKLFQIVRYHFKRKLQVVMSFHECGGNVGDDVHIPLPKWVTEIGEQNSNIFFRDNKKNCNSESLTWGVDTEEVLRGRTAVEVYFDYMSTFRAEFDEFFQDGTISEIEIGLGPCGELHYPSHPAKHGWKYPGIGQFQCYDPYLMTSLQKAAKDSGQGQWEDGPIDTGSYNSQPRETGFFRFAGCFEGSFGRFFLDWYSQVLVDHGDMVLHQAKLAFKGTSIAAKLSGIHWGYRTNSHAAELTAGYYNARKCDGYTPIAEMLKKHDTALIFPGIDLRTEEEQFKCPEALADPEGLFWQVLEAAWNVNIPVASENALPCYDREGYNKILEYAKHWDSDGRHLSAFTYLRLNPILVQEHNLAEFGRFVKRMHGCAVLDGAPSMLTEKQKAEETMAQSCIGSY